jgi:Flp pilus assembly protein TadD
VTLTPEDAEAHQSLGLTLLAQRRAAEAVAPFQRAVVLAPKDARKLAMLGSSL